MILLALLSALSTWAPVTPPAQDSTPFTVALRFDVTDTTAVFERVLDDSLVLRVTREGALGWIVSVVRRSAGPDQPNLLYHSLQWHGPYPTDVLAWSFKSHFFPDERLLPVYGYPYEIRIRLIHCRAAGSGENVVFEAGTIEVAWHRAPVLQRPGALSPTIDLYRAAMSFCCKPADGYHDLELFKDTANDRIGNAAIPGATIAERQRLGVDDLTARLEKLQTGNVLALRDGRYVLTFPVLTGARRDALAAAIRPVAAALAPRVAAMQQEIVGAIPGHGAMAFHLLWSRVMDQIWCRGWQREGRAGDCPPGVDWVLYPASPFTFGTNSWGNDFAVTWNLETRCAVTPVVTKAREALLAAARGQTYAGPDTAALQRYGLLDPHGRFTGFAYQADGPLDSLLDRLTHDYAALAVGRYDYGRLAAALGIPVDELWVILLHETGYAIFADLRRAVALDMPEIFTGTGDPAQCRETVSFLLHD